MLRESARVVEGGGQLTWSSSLLRSGYLLQSGDQGTARLSARAAEGICCCRCHSHGIGCGTIRPWWGETPLTPLNRQLRKKRIFLSIIFV